MSDFPAGMIEPTPLPGVFIIRPRVFRNARGAFFESWHHGRYESAGVGPFVQDNVSVSSARVLRGLHFQFPVGQGKLVTALEGEIFDVAVDIRPDSPSYRKWFGVKLSAETPEQLYIPPGFAHGFAVLSERAIVNYKCTDYYIPAQDRAIRWNDPEIGVNWPFRDAVLSDKDASAPLLRDVPPETLPTVSAASTTR